MIGRSQPEWARGPGRLSERSLVFVIPGDWTLPTGGFIYDRRLAAGLRDRDWTVRALRLDRSFPWPTGWAVREAEDAYAGIADDALVLTDGLVFGALPRVVGRHAERLRLVALVHHPLGYETGMRQHRALTLIRAEREALAAARATLVTSETTRRSLIEAFGVPAARIGVAPPGTDPVPLARGSGGPGLHLLAVGSIIPRKRFPALVEALAGLAHLAWELTIVGSPHRSPDEAARLLAVIARHGLAGRVTLTGEVGEDELTRLYDVSDVMVSSSAYEGFGMAVAEGLAHGLPVVAVAGGAVADWLDPGAALLVPLGRPEALGEALAAVLTDAALLARLQAGAVRARGALPTWADTIASAESLLLRASTYRSPIRAGPSREVARSRERIGDRQGHYPSRVDAILEQPAG